MLTTVEALMAAEALTAVEMVAVAMKEATAAVTTAVLAEVMAVEMGDVLGWPWDRF